MQLGRLHFTQAGIAAVLAFVVSPAVVAVFIGWFESVRPFEGMFVVSAPLLFAALAALAALARGTATTFKIPLMSKQLEFSQKEDRGHASDGAKGEQQEEDDAGDSQGTGPSETRTEKQKNDALQQGAMLRTVGILVFFLSYFLTWSWNYSHKTPSVDNLFPNHTLNPDEILEIHSLRLNLLFDMDASSIAAEFGLSRASFNAPTVDTVIKDVIGSILESIDPGEERTKRIKAAATRILRTPNGGTQSPIPNVNSVEPLAPAAPEAPLLDPST